MGEIVRSDHKGEAFFRVLELELSDQISRVTASLCVVFPKLHPGLQYMADQPKTLSVAENHLISFEVMPTHWNEGKFLDGRVFEQLTGQMEMTVVNRIEAAANQGGQRSMINPDG